MARDFAGVARDADQEWTRLDANYNNYYFGNSESSAGSLCFVDSYRCSHSSGFDDVDNSSVVRDMHSVLNYG